MIGLPMTYTDDTEPAQTAGHSPYRTLVESFAQAVWEADTDGLLPGSDSWHKLTGQPATAHSGMGWLDALHPEDREAARETWLRAAADGAIYSKEYRVNRPGLGWAWTLARATPLPGDSGTPLRWLGMNIDISARKTAELALVESERQKDDFIAILAHELRNPLAPLRSGIELLQNEHAPIALKARALNVMSRQTFHMSRLIEDLVDAGRITRGALQVSLEQVKLADVLLNAVANIQPATDAKRQQVVVHGLEATAPLLHADPVRLNQAFVNILNNCAKFSPQNSVIRIIVERQGDFLSVTFKDRGRAIPASDVPNIFKLFVQSARHDRGDGLGIGMAIAHDVVRLHGGTIEARSGPDGDGAEFQLKLPVIAFDPASSMELKDSESATATAEWDSLRVLVVDDNAEAAETLGALLEMAGHTLRIVHDGLQAVEEVPLLQPDVVLMDIGMPVMGGLEATRRIRAMSLTVRPFIIAITGWGSDADRVASKAAGCDLHMTKPVDFDAVAAAIAGRPGARAS